MSQLAVHKKETGDESGFIYDMHEKVREILSDYNDTLIGRCAVCLEPFCESEERIKEERFTNRPDLVRID